MTLNRLIVMAVVLLAAEVFAADTPALKTPMERQSYGLGVDMGKNLKRQGAEIDPEIVVRGIKDAMSGDKVLLTDEELFSTMKSFAAERRAKQNKDKPTATQGDATKIEDMETLYAMGVILSQQLSSFDLTRPELALVKQGLTDASAGNAPQLEAGAYAERINAFARARRLAQGKKLAAMNTEFLERAAKEKGALKTDSGLVYLSLQEGSGATPRATDTVKVHYRGTFPDGREFDSSYKRGAPVEVKMDGVVKCWNEGLQRMKAGGKSKLVCPPETAYGDKGAGDLILPYATLVFEVELLDLKN